MSVLGVGVCRPGHYAPTRDGKYTREYQLWKDMLRRCYSETVQKKQPAYVGCTVEPDLQDFQIFAAWANAQKGFHVPGYQMDKDLLVPGNREYRKDRVVFVPRALNNFLIADTKRCGVYPQGVYLDTEAGQFKAQLSVAGRRTNLGRYASVKAAAEAYAAAKTLAGREWAEILRTESLVDFRVIERMAGYIFKQEN